MPDVDAVPFASADADSDRNAHWSDAQQLRRVQDSLLKQNAESRIRESFGVRGHRDPDSDPAPHDVAVDQRVPSERHADRVGDSSQRAAGGVPR